MDDSSAQNRRKRVERPAEAAAAGAEVKAPWWKSVSGQVLSLGLAVTITGVFGLESNVITGQQRSREQRCAIAQQIVLDESPSPALNAGQLTRLTITAVGRVEQCLGETK